MALCTFVSAASVLVSLEISRCRFFSGSRRSVLLKAAEPFAPMGETSPFGSLAASLLGSTSSCARFFLGDESCSLSLSF